MSAQDVGLILAVIVVWGVNFVALRVGLNGVPPMLLVCFRFVLSALPALFFVKRPTVRVSHVIVYGLVMGVAQFSLLYGSLKMGMPTGLSSIVMQTQSFFTLVFAVPLLGERVKPNQIAGMLIAASGLGLIVLSFNATVGPVPLAMCIGAASAWGLANVIARRAGSVEPLAFLVWASVVPPVPMLALSLALEGPGQIALALAHLGLISVAAMLFTAYLSTLLGYTLWNKMITKYGASQIAPFSLLVPIVGLLSTALALGEQITPVKLVAGGLVMAGLGVFVFGARIWAYLARFAPVPEPA